MRNMILCIAFALAGCGVDASSQPTKTSTAPLCGTEPHTNPDGTVSAIGCPYEQQYENITHHGQHLAAVEQLRAGGTAQGVSVTDSCGDWFLGQDAAGVTVFVSQSTGEVRSHGLVHAGFPTSALPGTLSLPIVAN